MDGEYYEVEGTLVGGTVVMRVPLPRPPEAPRATIGRPPVPTPAAGDRAARGQSAARMTHAPGFASVRWGDQLFVFTARQRHIVAVLWHAMANCCEYVGAETLLEEAECDGSRIRDVFRGHPAWRTMIQSAAMHDGPAGAYRLVPPPDPEGE